MAKHAQSKRVSDDSLGGYLGSLDEDDDSKEPHMQPIMLQMKSPADIGVLKKSSSGTRIYVREESPSTDRQMQRQHRMSAPPKVEEVQRMLQQAKANVHQPRKERIPIWKNHMPVSRSSSTPLSPNLHSPSENESSDGLNDSVLFDYTYMVSVESKTEEARPKEAKRPLAKSQSLDNAPSNQVGSPRPLQMKQPHRHTPVNAPDERPRSKSLLRANAVEEDGTLQKKGMTSRGADLFPAHAMKQLYRKSLDESVISLGDKSASCVLKQTRSNSSHQPAMSQGAGEHRPSSAPQPQRPGPVVEKSASESAIAEWQRPRHPPSYLEAIQRKACLRSVSPQEIERQRQKNAVAKKLYEDSVKKADEVRNKQEAVGESSPPCYEAACQRAEQLKEQKGTPPKYTKRETLQSSLSREVLRKGSDHLKENQPTSRESTPTRSDSSSREGSMNRRHRRRSKDRRIGHRNSDTKLGSPIKYHRGTESSLNRSKSDSSEHINKISKLKLAKYNKEGFGSKRIFEPNVGRGSTPERKHSLENLEKTAKDLENEKMRRNNLARSTENISYKSLADNMQCVDAELDVHKPSTVRSRSVKNRNWHRDLAEQYSDNSSNVPATVSRYSYSSRYDATRAQESGRRRWTPIVHPTKDLVIAQVPSSRSSAPVRRAQSHVGEYRQRPTDGVLSRTPSSGRPVSEPKLPTEKRDSPSAGVEGKPKDEAARRSLGWSVSELRNLYAREDPAAEKQGSRSLPRTAPYSERTNPDAEEAYV
jgi:hypothetical protein